MDLRLEKLDRLDGISPFNVLLLRWESLQSKQITNFLLNFIIKAVVLEVDGPKKTEVANVR